MPIKLLLADDSVVIQKLVGLSFANEDIEIITVDNGDDAVVKAVASKPDIVLADVVMPGKNGYEVCSEVRGNADLAGTPVLLLTGTFEAFDEGRATEVGATGHITKPFEAQALVDRVNEILAAQPSAGTAAAPTAETGSDFFDENTGDLGMDASAEQTNPLAKSPASAVSPEAPTQAVDFGFGSSDPKPTATPAAKNAGGIDDGLGVEAADVPMGGDQTVAIMPDSDLPVGDAWNATPSETPMPAAPRAKAEPAPTPAAPPPTSNPDQTMLIDDFMGAETPERMPDPTTPAEGTRGGSAIGSLELASMPAPNPLDEMDPLGDDDDLDIDGLSFEDAAPLDAPVPPPAPSLSGDETVIADDLFGDDPVVPNPREAATNPPLAAKPPVSDPPAPSASQGLDIDFGAPGAEDSLVPDNASDYDVSASDLQVDPLRSDSSWGRGVPTGVVTGPDPITPPHDVAPPPQPEPREDNDLDSSPGLDADWNEPIVDDEPTPEPEPKVSTAPEPAAPAAGFGTTAPSSEPEPTPSVAPASPAPSSSTDLSPDMRGQIHDTLEKVAWEAFSDLSDDLVKQLVDRVEQIAWEVIPQMAETLIKEEIRKMKGEEGEDV